MSLFKFISITIFIFIQLSGYFYSLSIYHNSYFPGSYSLGLNSKGISEKAPLLCFSYVTFFTLSFFWYYH